MMPEISIGAEHARARDRALGVPPLIPFPQSGIAVERDPEDFLNSQKEGLDHPELDPAQMGIEIHTMFTDVLSNNRLDRDGVLTVPDVEYLRRQSYSRKYLRACIPPNEDYVVHQNGIAQLDEEAYRQVAKMAADVRSKYPKGYPTRFFTMYVEPGIGQSRRINKVLKSAEINDFLEEHPFLGCSTPEDVAREVTNDPYFRVPISWIQAQPEFQLVLEYEKMNLQTLGLDENGSVDLGTLTQLLKRWDKQYPEAMSSEAGRLMRFFIDLIPWQRYDATNPIHSANIITEDAVILYEMYVGKIDGNTALIQTVPANLNDRKSWLVIKRYEGLRPFLYAGIEFLNESQKETIREYASRIKCGKITPVTHVNGVLHRINPEFQRATGVFGKRADIIGIRARDKGDKEAWRVIDEFIEATQYVNGGHRRLLNTAAMSPDVKKKLRTGLLYIQKGQIIMGVHELKNLFFDKWVLGDELQTSVFTSGQRRRFERNLAYTMAGMWQLVVALLRDERPEKRSKLENQFLDAVARLVNLPDNQQERMKELREIEPILTGMIMPFLRSTIDASYLHVHRWKLLTKNITPNGTRRISNVTHMGAFMYTDPSRPYAMPEAGMEYSAPLAFVDRDGNKDIVDYGKLYRLIRQAGRYFLLAVQNQADFAELLGGQQMKRGKNIPQDIDTSPISGPVRKGDTSHRHDKTKVIVRGKHPTGQLVRKPGNTPAERRKNSNLAGRNSPIEISDSGAEQEETNDKQTIFARGSNPGHIGEPPDDFQDDRFDSAGGEDHQEDDLV